MSDAEEEQPVAEVEAEEPAAEVEADADEEAPAAAAPSEPMDVNTAVQVSSVACIIITTLTCLPMLAPSLPCTRNALAALLHDVLDMFVTGVCSASPLPHEDRHCRGLYRSQLAGRLCRRC